MSFQAHKAKFDLFIKKKKSPKPNQKMQPCKEGESCRPNQDSALIDQQVGNGGPSHKQPGIDRAELIMLQGREGKVKVEVKN